jgi:hypothetical protein
MPASAAGESSRGAITTTRWSSPRRPSCRPTPLTLPWWWSAGLCSPLGAADGCRGRRGARAWPRWRHRPRRSSRSALQGLLAQPTPANSLKSLGVDVALVHQPPGLHHQLLGVVEGQGRARPQAQAAEPAGPRPGPWPGRRILWKELRLRPLGIGARAGGSRLSRRVSVDSRNPTTQHCMANSSPAAKSSPVYDWFEERLEIQAIADDISARSTCRPTSIFLLPGRHHPGVLPDPVRHRVCDDLLLQAHRG